jgi:hypothetical protein
VSKVLKVWEASENIFTVPFSLQPTYIIIGNASSPGPLDEENIEKIPVEDLRKMVRKLQFQVNQLNNTDEKK